MTNDDITEERCTMKIFNFAKILHIFIGNRSFFVQIFKKKSQKF